MKKKHIQLLSKFLDKYLIVSLLLIAFFSEATSQALYPVKNNAERIKNLKIKKENNITYGFLPDSIQIKEKVSIIYDTCGRIIEKRYLSPFPYKSENVYDIKGNLILTKDYNNENIVTDIYSAEYDKNNLLTSTHDTSLITQFGEKIFFEYDDNRRLMQELRFMYQILDVNNSLYNKDPIKTTYKYDFNGNIVEIYEMDENVITRRYSYSYDEKQRKKKTIHSWRGIVKSIREYAYDQHGNLKEESVYHPDSTLDFQHRYEYDSLNNIRTFVAKSIYKDLINESKHEFIYDEDGLVIQELSFSGSGRLYSVTRYYYEY